MALPANAFKTFVHAGRHGYNLLLGKLSMRLYLSFLDILSSLGVRSFGFRLFPRGFFDAPLNQIRYHTAWEKQLQWARLYPHNNGRAKFLNVKTCYAQNIIDFIARLEDVKALKNLTAVFGEILPNDMNILPTYLRAWRAMIESSIQAMRSFDTYLP